MIVSKYNATVVTIENRTDGVYTLEFSSAKKFKYAPGTFLHLALDEYDPSSSWPDSRCFSIQSSSAEENIKITYAVKGGFTRRMEQELRVGKRVWLKLPYGNLFTQEHDKDNTVFIAGGTGITPYLSLFTDPSFSEYKTPYLYAGFRSKDFYFCAEELNKAKSINSALGITFFFEDSNGIIDIGQIYNEHTDTGTYFISGPPAMIKAFKEYLCSQGVVGDKIKTDDWE